MKITALVNVVLVTVLLSSIFFINIITSASDSQITALDPYDPWRDLNDDGSIDVLDAIYFARAFATQGTPINKTALLLELQAKIDELNATIVSLESRVSTLEGQVVVEFCAEISHYTTQSWTPPPASLNPNQIKVDFPVTFTNPSNVEISVSGVVTTGSCAGYPLRVTAIQIDTTYVILSLQGWNGSSWVDLSAGDEVDISYVAIER